MAEFGHCFRIPGRNARALTVVTSPEDMIRVFVTETDRYTSRGAFDYMAEVAPDMMLLQDEDHARRVRQLMLPALSPRSIADYLPHVTSYAGRALDRLPVDADFELTGHIRELTLAIAVRALLDIDLEAARFAEMATAIHTMIEFAVPMERSQREARRPEFTAARQRLRAFLHEKIHHRRDNSGGADILSRWMEAQHNEGTPLSDDQLLDNTWGLLFAGHDTTSNTLAWAIYLLCRHPDVAARTRGEVDGILGRYEPRLRDIQQLHYLGQVINEVMRLYPPAYGLARLATTDGELSGYRVHAGDYVMGAALLTHRRPDLWPDPDSFRPERWEGPAPAQGVYLAFGLGPRTCPGRHLAAMETRAILAMALQRFEFALEPGQEVIPHAAPPAMRPLPGVRVRAYPRHPLHL